MTLATIPNDPLCPPPGTKAGFRVCDACAYGLSAVAGAPKCELFWPEKERDRAVAASAAFLQQYGHNFRPTPQWNTPGYASVASVELALPIRQRPATPEDVRHGETVFSLAGPGSRYSGSPVRVCKLPNLPLVARWTTRKDYPVLVDRWDAAAGKFKKTIGYQQDGVVWQAEEVQSGGRWQRYYGFVGRYGMARVPAEEIEFPWDWASAVQFGRPVEATALEPMPLDESFDIGWTAPGLGLDFRIGAPWCADCSVRNHSSLERTLPPLVAGGDRATPSGEAVAIDTRLCWVHPLAYMANADRNWRWTPLDPTKSNRLALNEPQRPLAPGEAFEVLRWDLNEQFGPLRAGLYGFKMKLVTANRPRAREEPGRLLRACGRRKMNRRPILAWTSEMIKNLREDAHRFEWHEDVC